MAARFRSPETAREMRAIIAKPRLAAKEFLMKISSKPIVALLLAVGGAAPALAQPTAAPPSPPCAASQPGADCKAMPPRPPRTSPEDMQKAMSSALDNMTPLMVRMTDATAEAMLDVAAKPGTAERIATFKRNLFSELQKKGFSRSEALLITASTAPPSAAGK